MHKSRIRFHRQYGRLFVLAALILAVAARPGQANIDLRYLVNFTHSPPIIDGQPSAGEWRDAVPSLDPWVLLGSPGNDQLDETNNRFEALWDENGIYIRHRVNYGEWDERGRNLLDTSYETLELLFDPNRDGESNDQTAPNDTGTDGYRLSFNQPLGFSEIRRGNVSAGYLVEAHVNSEFGSQGGIWSGFANMQIAQTTSIEEQFGYTEIFIPWADFNATNPMLGFSEELGDDIGLYHPDVPDNGEEWYFNIGRVETSGRRPSWTVASPDAQFLATRPHGILEFFRSSGEIRLCDINADGECTAADIDELTEAIWTASNEEKYDLNGDGTVSQLDRATWIEHPDFMFTYLGDSNLDQEFSTKDFVLVFQAAEYEDNIDLNSGWAEGDWNGDKEFNTRDFVDAFQTASYEKGPRQGLLNVVPEPNVASLFAIGLIGIITVQRARRR